MIRPPGPSRIFLTPEAGEQGRILWAQIRDVTDAAGRVEIFHFALGQFLLVSPGEAFGLCSRGHASLEDIFQRGQTANALMSVRVPKRYRLDVLAMERWGRPLIGSDLDEHGGQKRPPAESR